MENTKEEVATKVVEEKPVVDEAAEMKEEAEKTSDEVKPEEKKTEEAKPEEKKADEAKPEEKKADEAKPEEKKADDVTPELLEKIKKQVEFYFGNINMQRDKFMIEQVGLDEGWIPMTVMLNFKMLSSLSKDVDTILKSIESSELMEISEDKTKIRRKPSCPLPVYDDEYKKAQAARTLYIKGFPLTDIWISKLKEFFADFEPVENIIMRKYQDAEKKYKFKGSIFAQFETLEGAKAFMARESVKYGDTELIRKFSEDYAVEKAKEKEEKKQKHDKKKSEKENGDEEENQESEQKGLPKGSLLYFTGAGESSSWEDIKAPLLELGAEIAYIDYSIGDRQGWIRLQGTDAAKPLLEKIKDNKLEVDTHEITFKVLENEEEDAYLKTALNQMAKRQNKSRRGRPKKGRGGHGGPKGRKRHGSPLGNSPKKVAS